MDPQTNDEPNIYLSGVLGCGAKLEITQQYPDGNIEVVMTPRDGIPVADSADIKDGKLRVRFTLDSFLGTYQLMDLVVNPYRPNKKFSLTKFLFGCIIT